MLLCFISPNAKIVTHVQNMNDRNLFQLLLTTRKGERKYYHYNETSSLIMVLGVEECVAIFTGVVQLSRQRLGGRLHS